MTRPRVTRATRLYLEQQVELALKAVRIAENRRPRIKGELPAARSRWRMAVARLAAETPARRAAA